MILICSASGDRSTAKVIEWLSGMREPYVLVSEFSRIGHIRINLSNSKQEISFAVAGARVNLASVKSVWFRRDRVHFNTNYNKAALPEVFGKNFDYFIEEEYAKLKDFLMHQLSKKCLINLPADIAINKPEVLQAAIRHNIQIPDTYIGAAEHVDLKWMLINKPISEVISFYYEQYMCRLLTVVYKQTDIPDTFPLLLQTNVEKQFEVRTFFLNGDFHSIAIFSQQQCHTQTDYRNYDFSRPARTVPFALPVWLQQKCRAMLTELNLLSGSIDFIYSRNNEFVFLEVNPIGQFDNVNEAGNYYLEERIAHILSHEKK